MPAYNNYFPVNYQQYYPQTQMPQSVPTQQTQQSSSGIVWVQGEAGAKAYPVQAGTSMLLMDSEREQFYLKSTDMSGMPMPLRLFTYKEVVQSTEPVARNEIDMSRYITRDELETRLNALKNASNDKEERVKV